MSITDELREWFENAYAYGPFIGGEFPKKYAAPWFGWKSIIVEMLDRIDAEYESACAEAYGNGVMSVPIALDESQWVKLPVDADGVPICVGDVMENVVSPSIHREVTGVGVECFYAWEDGFGRYSQFDAPNYRHHHEPTVEDVLKDFIDAWAEWKDGAAMMNPVETYAAKLRLAGDAE